MLENQLSRKLGRGLKNCHFREMELRKMLYKQRATVVYDSF